MKRSNSLPQNVFEKAAEKSRSEKLRFRIPHSKIYRGRQSLNKTPSSNRGQMRNDARLMTNELDDDVYLSPKTEFHIYNCLPVQGRKSSEKEAPVLPSTLPSTDREGFFRNFSDYMRIDKMKKAANVVLHGENDTRTVVASKIKYKMGDLLWLILKAYFAGLEVGGFHDSATVYSDTVVKMREDKKGVIQIIEKFECPVLEGKLRMSPEYVAHVIACRSTIVELLEEWGRFEELFPHSKAMLLFPGVNDVMDRVTTLQACVNTINDLGDKIDQLGALFGVTEEEEWSVPFISPIDIQPSPDSVLTRFVGNSIRVKGMRKVLQRISAICDVSLSKAQILLQIPPKTYAEAAASALSRETELKPFGDMFAYGVHSTPFKEMNLPSPFPFFSYIHKIRLKLMMEWLRIRAQCGTGYMDTLTLLSLIEDSRDCLEEAVRVKATFSDAVGAVSGRAGKTREYDQFILQVFEKYVLYIRMWVSAHSGEGRDMSRLFPVLESEWEEAVRLSQWIPSAFSTLSVTLQKVSVDILRELLVDGWEREAEIVNEQIATSDLIDDVDEQEDTAVLAACRHFNAFLRTLKDRSGRLFLLIRPLVEKSFNAISYEIDGLDMKSLLADFIMVDFECEYSIFVHKDSEQLVDSLLLCLAEGRQAEEGTLVIVSRVLDWTGRRVLAHVDPSLRYLVEVVDRVLLVGRPISLHSKQDHHECSSHLVLSHQLTEFSSDALEMICQLRAHLSQLYSLFSFSELSPSHSSSFRFTVTYAFNLCMHFHKELARFLPSPFRCDFAVRSCLLISDYRQFLEDSRPLRSRSVPLWATPALTFMHYISHPSFTRLLNDEQFQKLVSDVDACKELIVGDNEQKYGTSSPRPKGISFSPTGTSRRERFAVAAVDTELMVERNIRSCLPMGEPVEMDREHFKMHNQGTQWKRTSPFRWRLLEKIGEGSFGVVHKAVREDGSSLLAVKSVRANRTVLVTLEHEVGILRDLSHPNLVKYFGSEVHGNEVLILMEYCSEGTLESICGEMMDIALVRKYTHSLLQAVSFIHRHHVIHRDIKPANIFLHFSSFLKLGDFGCARRLRGTDTVAGEFTRFEGTVNYTAPESLNGGGTTEGEKYRGYGRSVDIWSVGCVVLQMLTGRVPWSGMHYYQIIMTVGGGGKPEMGKYKQVSIVEQFISSCFQFNPDDRPSADKLLQHAFADVSLEQHNQ